MKSIQKRIKAAPEVRRRQILDAARKTLVNKSYGDIRLDDVALEAGVAKGTLYLHFKDKSEIMEAVFEDLMDQLEARLMDSEDKVGLEKLEYAAEANLDFLRENHDFFSQFMRFKDSLMNTNKKMMHKRFQKHLDVMRRFIEAAVEKKEVPRHDVSLGSFYFVSLIRMFWVKENFQKSKTDNSENAKQLLDLFLHGISGRKTGARS